MESCWVQLGWHADCLQDREAGECEPRTAVLLGLRCRVGLARQVRAWTPVGRTG